MLCRSVVLLARGVVVLFVIIVVVAVAVAVARRLVRVGIELIAFAFLGLCIMY